MVLKKFLKETRGAVDWGTILMLPALLILLVVVYSILPVIVDILFALIDVSPNIYYANLIKMLIGAIGLIMVIGVVWNLFTGLRGQPDYGQPQ